MPTTEDRVYSEVISLRNTINSVSERLIKLESKYATTDWVNERISNIEKSLQRLEMMQEETSAQQKELFETHNQLLRERGEGEKLIRDQQIKTLQEQATTQTMIYRLRNKWMPIVLFTTAMIGLLGSSAAGVLWLIRHVIEAGAK